ncbi:MAG: DUF3995 domain-containing protein [Nocardioidaceae bacterium]
MWSLGHDLVEGFQGREWVLVPIGVTKLVAALAPLALAHGTWPARVVTRSLCWLGALGLLVWGGPSTVVAHLVLVGAIRPESGFDRSGMVGHDYLWDPLFLAWGAAATISLFASRGGATGRH